MKRILSIFLSITIILSLVYIMPVYADSMDATIQARIDELYSRIGNKYFTTDGAACNNGNSCSSTHDHCKNIKVIQSEYFKNTFGFNLSSVDLFPGSPRCTKEANSCAGFASFAGWYIFKNSNTDNVRINKLDKMNYTYSNVTANAKIGDIVSLSGYKYNSDGSHSLDKNGNWATAGHEFIFISADSNGAYVLDSNWGNGCKVTKHYIRYSYCDYFQIGRVTTRGDVTPPVTEAPTNAWINANYVTASTYDNLTLTWGANGATSYWLHIYKDGQDFINESVGNSTSFTRTYPEGNYTAYIQASNTDGNKLVSVSFSIINQAPTNVGMICNYENMTINPGTQIQLDFWYKNGDSFDIIIDKNGSEYQRFNNVTSPFYYTPTERGNYIARGYAKNSVGSTESNRRAFYVKYVNAPTSVGMICNYENMTVKPGTQIQLDFWYSNGDSFDIVIDRNGVEYQRFNNVGSPFYYTPTEEGNYLARGYAKNEAGATESNRRAFYVSYSEPPTNVGMVCNYENKSVKPGTAIEFSYWYHNGNSFDVIIYRNNVEYERISNVSNPFYYVPSEEGNYLAVGYAKNSAGATESNRRAFNVLAYVPPIPNGTYSILSSLDNSYALNVYARDPGDNNTLIIWQDPSQKFDVTYIGGGLYKIISSVTGKALCARDSGMSSGTDLVQYTWNGSLNQKWRIEVADDGYFYIVNCLSGLYIEADNSNASNGTNVWLYEGNQSYAQKWLFTPLTYTISYNANGGENAPATQTKTHRQNLTLSNSIPTRTGYTFIGWSETPNAQSVSYGKGDTFTGNYNTTLYAVWKPKQYYLDVNGLLDDVQIEDTEGYGTFDLYINDSLVANDVCDSYYLCNYGDSYQITDIKNSVGRSYNGSSSSLVGIITYTTRIELQFNSNQYTVNFNASGGNLADLSKNVTYNSQYGELPIPVRKGYLFKGWYTASSGGDEITNTTMVTNISNHTLYAQWKKLIPDTDSSVTKKGSNYLINVVPIDIDDSCDVIIAGYKGGKFVTLTKAPYSSEEINATLSGDMDEIKVMLWNSLSGLMPLCEAEVIPSSAFIIE